MSGPGPTLIAGARVGLLTETLTSIPQDHSKSHIVTGDGFAVRQNRMSDEMLHELSRDYFWNRVTECIEQGAVNVLFGAGLSRKPPCRLPLFDELLCGAIKCLTSSILKIDDHRSWPLITVDDESI